VKSGLHLLLDIRFFPKVFKHAGKIFNPRAIPTGVGRGIGMDIKQHLGGGLGQSMFETNRRLSEGIPTIQGFEDDEPPAAESRHERYRFRWGWGNDERKN